MSSSSKRALIVDDNIALSRVTQYALDGIGFDTEIACNGRLALNLAIKSQFDIVITDQQMPELTGIELCQKLRDLANYADCPIILLTAKGLELELPRLQEELGISAIFAKPFSPSAIVKAVNELLTVPA